MHVHFLRTPLALPMGLGLGLKIQGLTLSVLAPVMTEALGGQ